MLLFSVSWRATEEKWLASLYEVIIKRGGSVVCGTSIIMILITCTEVFALVINLLGTMVGLSSPEFRMMAHRWASYTH